MITKEDSFEEFFKEFNKLVKRVDELEKEHEDTEKKIKELEKDNN